MKSKKSLKKEKEMSGRLELEIKYKNKPNKEFVVDWFLKKGLISVKKSDGTPLNKKEREIILPEIAEIIEETGANPNKKKIYSSMTIEPDKGQWEKVMKQQERLMKKHGITWQEIINLKPNTEYLKNGVKITKGK